MRSRRFPNLSKPKREKDTPQLDSNSDDYSEQAVSIHARLMKDIKRALVKRERLANPKAPPHCIKKKKYPTAAAAAKSAAARVSVAQGKLLLRAYQCEHCGKWHLTSKGLKSFRW